MCDLCLECVCVCVCALILAGVTHHDKRLFSGPWGGAGWVVMCAS